MVGWDCGVAEFSPSARRYWHAYVAPLVEGAPKPTLGSPTPDWAMSLDPPATSQKQQPELAPLNTPDIACACCSDQQDKRNQCRFRAVVVAAVPGLPSEKVLYILQTLAFNPEAAETGSQ